MLWCDGCNLLIRGLAAAGSGYTEHTTATHCSWGGGHGCDWLGTGSRSQVGLNVNSYLMYDYGRKKSDPLASAWPRIFWMVPIIITNGEGGRNIDIGLTAGSGFTHTSIHHSSMSRTAEAYCFAWTQVLERGKSDPDHNGNTWKKWQKKLCKWIL